MYVCVNHISWQRQHCNLTEAFCVFPGASEAEANFNFTPGFILRTEYVSRVAVILSHLMPIILHLCCCPLSQPTHLPPLHSHTLATPPHHYTCFHLSRQASCTFTPFPLSLMGSAFIPTLQHLILSRFPGVPDVYLVFVVPFGLIPAQVHLGLGLHYHYLV